MSSYRFRYISVCPLQTTIVKLHFKYAKGNVALRFHSDFIVRRAMNMSKNFEYVRTQMYSVGSNVQKYLLIFSHFRACRPRNRPVPLNKVK